MGWMVFATIGMVITLILTYKSKACTMGPGLLFADGLGAFIVHVVIAAHLPGAKASPLYTRSWGKIVQGIVFLTCMFLSGIPSFIMIKDPTNVYPLFGLIMWGLGLEMAFESKTGGNIFNLTLCVSYSVGITLYNTTEHVALGKFIAFGVPIISTILYQLLTPTSNSLAFVSLVRNSDGNIDEEQIYRFVALNPPQAYPPNYDVGSSIGLVRNSDGPSPMLIYKLVAVPMRNRNKRPSRGYYQLSDLPVLSFGDVLRAMGVPIPP